MFQNVLVKDNLNQTITGTSELHWQAFGSSCERTPFLNWRYGLETNADSGCRGNLTKVLFQNHCEAPRHSWQTFWRWFWVRASNNLEVTENIWKCKCHIWNGSSRKCLGARFGPLGVNRFLFVEKHFWIPELDPGLGAETDFSLLNIHWEILAKPNQNVCVSFNQYNKTLWHRIWVNGSNYLDATEKTRVPMQSEWDGSEGKFCLKVTKKSLVWLCRTLCEETQEFLHISSFTVASLQWTLFTPTKSSSENF